MKKVLAGLLTAGMLFGMTAVSAEATTQQARRVIQLTHQVSPPVHILDNANLVRLDRASKGIVRTIFRPMYAEFGPITPQMVIVTARFYHDDMGWSTRQAAVVFYAVLLVYAPGLLSGNSM